MNSDHLTLRQAIALRSAPKNDATAHRVAIGRAYLVNNSLEMARGNHIPIRQDKNLVEILSQLNLEAEIPKRFTNSSRTFSRLSITSLIAESQSNL